MCAKFSSMGKLKFVLSLSILSTRWQKSPGSNFAQTTPSRVSVSSHRTICGTTPPKVLPVVDPRKRFQAQVFHPESQFAAWPVPTGLNIFCTFGLEPRKGRIYKLSITLRRLPRETSPLHSFLTRTKCLTNQQTRLCVGEMQYL